MALHRAPQHCAADWHAAPSTKHAPTPELEDKTPPDPPSDDDTPRLDDAAVDDAPVEVALDDEVDAEVAAVLEEDEGQAPHVPLHPLSPHVPTQLGWQPPGCWQVMPWPVEGKQAHPAWVRQSASAEQVARQRSPALVLVQDAPNAQVLPGPHGVAHSPPGNPVRHVRPAAHRSPPPHGPPTGEEPPEDDDVETEPGRGEHPNITARTVKRRALRMVGLSLHCKERADWVGSVVVTIQDGLKKYAS